MNKKVLIIIGIVVIAVLGILFLATGRARTDVYLKDYEVSEDGKTMTLNVGVSSSAGYVRKIEIKSGSMNYYFTFYSTFGINSKLGAKDTFEIELDSNVDEIYFYTGDKGYKQVLQKSENGEWIESTINNDNNSQYDDYKKTSSLSSDTASTEVLVKFDGTLYGKSYAMIDYAGGSESIAVIDKLIDNEYVPKLDGETNTEEILNALVFDKTNKTIVLQYNNEYVLFEKISE